MANFGKQLVTNKRRLAALIVGAGVFLTLVVILLGSNANAVGGSGVQKADSKIAKVSAPAMIKPKTMKKPKKKAVAAPTPSSTSTPSPVTSSPSPAPTPQKKSSPKQRLEAPTVLR